MINFTKITINGTVQINSRKREKKRSVKQHQKIMTPYNWISRAEIILKMADGFLPSRPVLPSGLASMTGASTAAPLTHLKRGLQADRTSL